MNLRRLLVVLFGVVFCATAAMASPINYAFSGTLTGGGQVTGTFTLDAYTTIISAFSFDLNGHPLLDSSSNVVVDSESFTDLEQPLLDFQVGSGAGLVGLDFAVYQLPGDLVPGFIFNSNNYQSVEYTLDQSISFVSGNVVVTPEPSSWLLLTGGLLVAAVWCWKKREDWALAGAPETAA